MKDKILGTLYGQAIGDAFRYAFRIMESQQN